MRPDLKHFLLLFCSLTSLAQVQLEVDPPENIKSIIFRGPTEDQFPIVQLGESIYLEFDDLSASEQDYYYRLLHCDYDWQPSQLLKSQYLRGVDNQRIINYENSYTTLQPYSNYQLTIPNNQVSLRVSGNYILEIYNANNVLQFSRRFVVYQDQVKVPAIVRRSRDFEYLMEKQSVQFSVIPAGIQLINPKKEVKIAILQNYHWPTTRYNIPPQFTIGSELVYKYDKETAFFGGNEYLNFDSSDLRAPTAAISSIGFEDLYHHYLFPNRWRFNQEYTYFPDINGDFVIRTLQGRDPSREAEYTWVHFSLPYTDEIGFDQVYIFGKYNNYALEDLNRMEYNPDTGYMEAALLLKQGFYNFKYVIAGEDGPVALNEVCGNFHFTENTYTILVYYRNFGDIYDSVIGIGSTNSRNISN
ncbi:type IX secretion system plug protein [Robiginitalea sp. IMCC43444]|uniref:type IX secretion system plug protein n=1 Tax=Robiginitalea sp. IMCC43444 TaxID=3459121 RepID=UPI0040425567